LHTRMSLNAGSCAIGASSPELVVMSGTDRTYSMPLDLSAAITAPPLSAAEDGDERGGELEADTVMR